MSQLSAHTLPEHTLDEAAQWLAQLASGEATEHDKQQWRHWYDRTEYNRQAWSLVEELTGSLHQLPTQLTHSTIDNATESMKKRRRFIKGLVLSLVATPIAIPIYQRTINSQWNNDFHTAIGEIKTVTLADGSLMVMNTNTIVDITFDHDFRRIKLRQGEVLITTAHPQNEYRPLQVETQQGIIRALGTQFSVNQIEGTSHVAVFKDSVEITPNNNSAEKLHLSAGKSVRFWDNHIDAVASLDDSKQAWSQGMLIVNDWPLEKFITELSRYRPGHLSCSDSAALLRISGSFPLSNTDTILASLAETLPVKVRQFSPYWVRIEAQ